MFSAKVILLVFVAQMYFTNVSLLADIEDKVKSVIRKNQDYVSVLTMGIIA